MMEDILASPSSTFAIGASAGLLVAAATVVAVRRRQASMGGYAAITDVSETASLV
jgi:hypothetical protein